MVYDDAHACEGGLITKAALIKKTVIKESNISVNTISEHTPQVKF